MAIGAPCALILDTNKCYKCDFSLWFLPENVISRYGTAKNCVGLAVLAIAAGGEDGKEIAQFVCDSHFAEWQMMTVYQFLRLGRDKTALCSFDECDVGCGCDG